MAFSIEKTEYIINSLTKGSIKRYETYVINAIYQRLNNHELEIVTQKYVKNKIDDKYYLIDLYLPQFHIGLEIDESYHEKQITEDEYRKQRIIYLTETEEIKRIKISENGKMRSLDEINKDIDEFCDYLKAKDNYNSIKWLYGSEKIDEIKERGNIVIGDVFRTNAEVINLISDKKYKIYRPGIYKINNQYLIWFPIIDSFYKDDKDLSVHNHWKNTITDDYLYVYEQPYTNRKQVKKASAQNDLNKKIKRYLFLKDRDSFGKPVKIFVGLYESMGWDENKQAEKWKRIVEVKELKIVLTTSRIKEEKHAKNNR